MLRSKKAYIIDCDGVLYHGTNLLPGAKELVNYLQDNNVAHLFLTNASDKTNDQLVDKFSRLGLSTAPEHFYTSAMSTATFLARQKPGGRAFVIGTASLKACLEAEGVKVVDEVKAEMSTPDFLVVGECTSDDVYSYSKIEFAVKMVRRGARFFGTNEDVADRIGLELQPGTGAITLPIEAASGFSAYYLGKPNPLMIQSAIERLNVHRSDAVVVGDRMNTDIKAGVEAGIDTVLVLSGVTSSADILKFPYRPSSVLPGVGDIVSYLENMTTN